jgi:hypothetical protein
VVTGSVHSVVAKDDEECFRGGNFSMVRLRMELREFSLSAWRVVWAETVADVVYTEKVGDEEVKGGIWEREGKRWDTMPLSTVWRSSTLKESKGKVRFWEKEEGRRRARCRRP